MGSRALVLIALVVCVSSCGGRNHVREEAITLTGDDPDKGK